MTRIEELFEVRERYLFKYKQLRENFLKIANSYVNFEGLNELKLRYDNVINSRRESERIHNLEGLFKILEKRSVLRYDSIEPIEEIAASFVKDQQLNREINHYLVQLKNRQISEPLSPFNVFKYQSERRGNTNCGSSFIRHSANQTFVDPLRINNLQSRVFEKVSENLGKHWRDVARFLDIKEGEIDTIQQDCNLGMKQKAFEVFQIFKLRCECSEWQTKLVIALTKARRQDLAEIVEQLIQENE